MGKLTNLGLTEKIYAIIAVTLIGFMMVGAVYAYVQYDIDRLTTLEINLEKFEAAFEGIEIELLEAQAHEKKFELTRNIDEANLFKTQLVAADKHLTDLIKTAPEGVDREPIEALEKHFVDYEEAFEKVVEVEKERGLDQTQGVEGALNSIVDELEKQVNQANDSQLTISYLHMRQAEKDFLIHEKQSYIGELVNEKLRFLARLPEVKIEEEHKRLVASLAEDYLVGVRALSHAIKEIHKAEEEAENILAGMLVEFKEIVASLVALILAEEVLIATEHTITNTLYIVVSLLISLTIIALLVFFARNLRVSLTKTLATVNAVAAGNFEARTQLTSKDEMGQLANQLDSLLDERNKTFAAIEKEKTTADKINEQLNDSVVVLMDKVFDLSKRDLTIRVPVAEDVTGPVSDALNLMTGEIVKVLKDINVIAKSVSTSSDIVKQQGSQLSKVAEDERETVERTMNQLEESSASMKKVANLAQVCNTMATQSSKTTQAALTTVKKTAEGMNDTRETISETEKRIKRLGERSQEINVVVGIINNIAERTHVLALNASMQAAAAGEAGRGFSVVADEVQRLAESSRQSTAEIAALVGNIQSETAEAMTAMNKTITLVIEGTDLAQQSGEQMAQTEKITRDLASAVEKIAQSSAHQAKAAVQLRTDAVNIVESTQKTATELQRQEKETNVLVQSSVTLLQSVGVFKLPV